MKIGLLVFCFLFLPTQEVIAQEKLSPNQTVARKIEPGKTDRFSIALNDGDYFNVSIGYKGRINFFLLNPDGTIARRVITSSTEAKGSFVFAAEGAGSYSFKIENPGNQSAGYELGIGEVLSLNERLKPEPRADPFPSPRIQTLRKQIEAGNSNAEAFWKEIAEHGTPFVEPFGSDGKYQLVTFLWRTTHDTRNVFVIGSFLGVGAPADYAMHQIPNSDVWYLTLKLPSGARFTYQLSPNDPLTFEGPRAAQRAATRQSDPFNPHRSECPPNTSKFRCQSVAELPGAPLQPWIVPKPEIAEGRVEKQTIKSTNQKIDRPFSVYTPANYKTDGPPNALLILFDGEDLPNDPYPLTTLNNLIAASKIPPTVAVFVENVPRRRLVDLVANPEFADFMANELVPWVRSHYNVTKDPKQTVVTGYSAGGLAAPYVALRHPEVFGNVLSRSGAFWWSFEHSEGICGPRCPDSGGRGGENSKDATTEGNFMVKQFLASPKLPLRFYLAAGTFEIDRDGGGGNILESTRHLRDVLLAKGYQVHYQQFVGGHDGLSWRGTLADGLIALLGVH
ncbi:MAG TPA: alpha/beta hydrolase-fold protein [Acidobacteriota bacterium]|jgi:enterochelin esterase family protein|nr:alpha/beta hydrolase-fold protein [Acidobacteriota bacterium]